MLGPGWWSPDVRPSEAGVIHTLGERCSAVETTTNFFPALGLPRRRLIVDRIDLELPQST